MPPKAKPVKQAIRATGRKRVLEEEDSDPMEVIPNENRGDHPISASSGNSTGNSSANLSNSNPGLKIAASQYNNLPLQVHALIVSENYLIQSKHL